MINLSRGVRKRGKKLYRLSLGFIASESPIYVWRTKIDETDKKMLLISGFKIVNVGR